MATNEPIPPKTRIRTYFGWREKTGEVVEDRGDKCLVRIYGRTDPMEIEKQWLDVAGPLGISFATREG